MLHCMSFIQCSNVMQYHNEHMQYHNEHLNCMFTYDKVCQTLLQVALLFKAVPQGEQGEIESERDCII